MTDNEIIKALEHCIDSCNSLCPLHKNKDCRIRLCLNALDLINRQKAEIKRLQKEQDLFADIGKMYSEIKAEAVKEFAERFIQKDGEMNHIFDDCADILVPEEYKKGRDEKTKEIRQTIDKLLKEMVGDE